LNVIWEAVFCPIRRGRDILKTPIIENGVRYVNRFRLDGLRYRWSHEKQATQANRYVRSPTWWKCRLRRLTPNF